MVVLCFAAVVVFVYAFTRRQWLKHVRSQAVEAATAMTTNLQAFELSSSASLSLIQEVELVSRGYRMRVILSLSIVAAADQTQKYTFTTSVEA